MLLEKAVLLAIRDRLRANLRHGRGRLSLRIGASLSLWISSSDRISNIWCRESYLHVWMCNRCELPVTKKFNLCLQNSINDAVDIISEFLVRPLND